jgi:3-phenylpropionate/trans-cinnamate dioxygenase ferredoxin reductase component
VTLPRSVLVVGAGLAGARCAETLRSEGFGGDIVLVGDEPLPPYERPALSKEFLIGSRSIESLGLRPVGFWEDRGIELLLGRRVVSVDRAAQRAITDRGEELRWDALVAATGARPRRLPLPAPPGVHVLRTLRDATALSRELRPGAKLVVVGGGFVGAEVASTALDLGVEVTMLEAAPTPFGRALGRQLGELLAARYRDHGVELLTETVAGGFRPCKKGIVGSVLLSDGHELECDTVLVAVGVEPAAELLDAPATPPVYACGDVAGGVGHWTAAAAEGTSVAREILGLDPLPEQPPFFWSDQFGLRIQLVGDPSGAASMVIEGSADDFIARYWADDERLVAAVAANRPADVGVLRRELALAA